MMNWKDLLSAKRPSSANGNNEENEELSLSPFERDYFTIINSSYFRRLQNKTQVYTLDKNDFVRTRLTHSLEVASIAEILGRRIAERIIERCQQVDLPQNFREDLPMVCRCAGLLHDIGNPPFGHAGEEYIRDFFQNNEAELRGKLSEQMWLDLINFEGNAQNVRIVTRMGRSSNPNDEKYGMDLTYAVINSLIKYPVNSLQYKNREEIEGKKKRGKIGYYHSEEWIVTRYVMPTGKGTGTLLDEKTLLKDPVMLIMEAADDISYATADIEDAIKKNYIDPQAFIEKLPPEERSIKLGTIISKTLKKIKEQSMVDVINKFMANYDSIMDGTFKEELIDGGKYDINGFKKLMMNSVFEKRDEYTNHRFYPEIKISYIIEKLIGALKRKPEDTEKLDIVCLDAMRQFIEEGEKEVYNITKNMKGHFTDTEIEKKRKLEALYHNYLAVVDFVSGMTDSYLNDFYDNLFNDSYIDSQFEILKRKYKNESNNFRDGIVNRIKDRITEMSQREN